MTNDSDLRRNHRCSAGLRTAFLNLEDWVGQFAEIQARANDFSEREMQSRHQLIGRHIQDDGLHCVGAFCDNHLAGFAFGAPFTAAWPWAVPLAGALAEQPLWTAFGPAFWLLEIHVLPNLWRQRIGTALLDVLREAAGPQWIGLTRMTAAERARRFYEHHGFSELPVPGPPGYVVMGAPPALPPGTAWPAGSSAASIT